MIKTILTAAAVSLAGFMGSAQAATLNGLFTVTAVNVTNLNDTESRATLENFNAALGGTLGGSNPGNPSVSVSTTFTYDGDIAFATTNNVPQGNSTTTIAQWLATGVDGSVTGLDAAFGLLQQSKGNVFGNPGTGTSTFYLFESVKDVAGDAGAKVRHDDGFAIFRNGNLFADVLGPTSVVTTTLEHAFNRGGFALLYVATNSDPSILKIDGLAQVPLPAPIALLAAGVAGLGALRLRRKAA